MGHHSQKPLLKALIGDADVIMDEASTDAGASGTLTIRFCSIIRMRTCPDIESEANFSSCTRSNSERPRSLNREISILKQHNKPVVTTTVHRIAKGLFLRTLIEAKQSVDESGEDMTDVANICLPELPIIVHDENPKSIKWGLPVRGCPNYYRSVYLDGVEYKVSRSCFDKYRCPDRKPAQVGDTVVVEPGEDDDVFDARNAKMSSAQTTNALANSAWSVFKSPSIVSPWR